MKGIIKLQYRKIFDQNVQKVWDKYVFDDTHLEYKMKCQEYTNEPEKTPFKELLKINPKAEKLHYLVSLASLNYLRWLEDKVPDIFNLVGERCIPFENFKFEILQSHYEDKSKHKVQIDFFSNPLYWIDTIGDNLLLSTEKPNLETEIKTFMLDLQANLTIYSIQNL
jgi:hypothetical protein